jgi:hypothetical protein
MPVCFISMILYDIVLCFHDVLKCVSISGVKCLVRISGVEYAITKCS